MIDPLLTLTLAVLIYAVGRTVIVLWNRED
jgi:hypothetical protein